MDRNGQMRTFAICPFLSVQFMLPCCLLCLFFCRCFFCSFFRFFFRFSFCNFLSSFVCCRFFGNLCSICRFCVFLCLCYFFCGFFRLFSSSTSSAVPSIVSPASSSSSCIGHAAPQNLQNAAFFSTSLPQDGQIRLVLIFRSLISVRNCSICSIR